MQPIFSNFQKDFDLAFISQISIIISVRNVSFETVMYSEILVGLKLDQGG